MRGTQQRRVDGRDAEALGRLIRAGRSSEAVLLADSAKAQAQDASEYAQVLLMKFGGLLNTRRTAECPVVADEAAAVLADAGEPALEAELHALLACLAHSRGALDRCLTHLIQGVQRLEQARQADQQTAMAWLDLSVTFSLIGLHRQAIRALSNGQQVARSAMLDPADFAHPEIQIRAALSLDQRGDTDTCARILRDVMRNLGPGDVARFELPHLGYALVRLAALGVPILHDPRPLLDVGIEPYGEVADIRLLAKVCLALAHHDPAAALRQLDLIEGHVYTMGEAEVPRLRAIAHAAAGDHRAALRAEREAAKSVMHDAERVQCLFLDGISSLLRDGQCPTPGRRAPGR